MNLKDYQNQQENLSLLKIVGKKVKDITGYVSMEFGSPVFKVSFLVFEDDTELWFEGEHDFPYVTNSAVDLLDDDLLQEIYDAENEDEDDNPF